MTPRQPRILGIDDAPFEKGQSAEVPVVGVVMEGASLVEGVAISSFPVDGARATAWLASWVESLKWHPALQAIVLGGATLAGLGLLDLEELAARLGHPVLSVTRRPTERSDLAHALEAAGFPRRRAILNRLPPSRAIEEGLWLACAGVRPAEAEALLRASLARSKMPEALRIAHLIGAALARGESRGRV